MSHLEWLAYLSIIVTTHSPNFSVPAVKPMSLQKAFDLTAFDGVEVVGEGVGEKYDYTPLRLYRPE